MGRDNDDKSGARNDARDPGWAESRQGNERLTCSSLEGPADLGQDEIPLYMYH